MYRLTVVLFVFLSSASVALAAAPVDCRVLGHSCAEKIQVVKKSCHEKPTQANAKISSESSCNCGAHFGEMLAANPIEKVNLAAEQYFATVPVWGQPAFKKLLTKHVKVLQFHLHTPTTPVRILFVKLSI